jgi:positive control factor
MSFDADNLIKEYKETLKNTQELYKRVVNLDSELNSDKRIIRGIIGDLEFNIEWMSTGRRPGNKRGIERRAAYQRERPFDPLIIQRYFRSMGNKNNYEWDKHDPEDNITSIDKDRIDDALSVLTKREKEIYLMSRGYSLSFSEISNYLGLTVSTVKTNIKRAETKISKRIKDSLFCLCG